MPDDLFNSFIEVIDSGSFAKAAAKLHLSATALMKQMNVLEAQVGVQLLIRTNHGIRATDAGVSFYHDARFMLEYSEKAVIRARQMANKDPYTIRVGNSMLYPCKVLLDLWNEISTDYPQFKMKIVPFEHDSETWPTVYRTLGKDFDVIVGAYDRTNGFDDFRDLRLGEYRVCISVSREHRLARKERLSLTDLAGERIVMLRAGISPVFDGIRRCLLSEYPEIHMKDIPQHYTIDTFNRCEELGAVLLTIDAWKDVHPSLITIPVDWEFTIPYGVLYPLKPSNSVQLFLRVFQAAEFSNSLPIPT